MSIFFAGHSLGMPAHSNFLSKVDCLLSSQYGSVYSKYDSTTRRLSYLDFDPFPTLQTLDDSDLIVLDITYTSFEMGVLLEHIRNRLLHENAPKILCIFNTLEVHEKILWTAPRMLNCEIVGYHTLSDCSNAIVNFLERNFPNEEPTKGSSSAASF